jgi:hypothetical protein
MITKVDRQACHSFSWLNGGLESSVHTVEYPIVDGTTVVCFESHLVAGLGLPPSKFLVAVISHLGCELVHFNPSVIVALSYFTMLCVCWLGIAPDTSLFWYSTPRLGTRRLSSTGLDCLFFATVGRNTSRLPSRAVGRCEPKVVPCRYARPTSIGEQAFAPTAN